MAGLAEADTEKSDQFDGAEAGVCSAVEIADAEQASDDERQQREQPADQEAARFMMADMFEALPGFAVIEALVFDLPSASGHFE